MAELPPIEPAEAAAIGAVDGVFFSRYFFPRTARQAPAPFECKVWDLLDSQEDHFAAMMIFRGGAKTTRLRIFTAKRVAYALSRTIIYVGKSQDHAIRSIKWLKKQIEFNRPFATTFGLSKGSKWTDEEIEIFNSVAGVTITIVAFGITGSIRGVNIDDYRPDLIIGDDLCDPENSKTIEQREKIKDLWFADLRQSLAPVSENPDAKMVLLGTMLDPEDVTATCCNDSGWKSLIVPILDEHGESTWPDRFSTETILADRDQYLRLNKLSLWMRECMCVWQAPEDSVFLPEWFEKRYDTVPPFLHIYAASDTAVTKTDRADYTEHGVFGVDYNGDYYVLDWWFGKRGSDEWIERQCDLIKRHKPLIWFGETGQIRNAVEPFLRKRMQERGTLARLEWLPSVSDKVTRAQGIVNIAASGKLWFPREATWVGHVLAQLLAFPSRGVHDDAVDVLSLLARGLDRVKLPRQQRSLVDDFQDSNVFFGNFGGAQAWMR